MVTTTINHAAGAAVFSRVHQIIGDGNPNITVMTWAHPSHMYKFPTITDEATADTYASAFVQSLSEFNNAEKVDQLLTHFAQRITATILLFLCEYAGTKLYDPNGFFSMLSQLHFRREASSFHCLMNELTLGWRYEEAPSDPAVARMKADLLEGTIIPDGKRTLIKYPTRLKRNSDGKSPYYDAPSSSHYGFTGRDDACVHSWNRIEAVDKHILTRSLEYLNALMQCLRTGEPLYQEQQERAQGVNMLHALEASAIRTYLKNPESTPGGRKTYSAMLRELKI